MRSISVRYAKKLPGRVRLVVVYPCMCRNNARDDSVPERVTYGRLTSCNILASEQIILLKINREQDILVDESVACCRRRRLRGNVVWVATADVRCVTVTFQSYAVRGCFKAMRWICGADMLISNVAV